MDTQKSKIPVFLILLDLVGAILVAIGILGALDEGTVGDYLLLAAGLVLMLPLVLYILNRMTGRR
ncbi:MAG: hypothetical protein EP324_00065 [Gammaproteobacteria bacterium]|nr:MAG: hypothetical protein EP324_00065 [Gammaproteobacteria bacterium]